MTRRILLIEDEPLSQDIITALLRGQGYEVDVATDGFAALDRARSTRYAVALVDYHLPEMDGYALGRLLREQHPGDAGGPVLIGLTADRNGLAARRGSDAVFRAILPKPIKPAELFATIERLCEADAPPVPAETEPGDARRTAAALWRSHGLALPPKAFASPPPSAEQAAALTLCFELVEPAEAHCVVLLERHGINEALRIARRDRQTPLPIVGLSADHADICDSLFRVDDAASWQALAGALGAQPAASSLVALPTPKPAHQPMPQPTAPVTDAEPRPVLPAMRDLLLSGLRLPLDRLRDACAAELRVTEPAGERRMLLDRIEALDSMLLVAGTIADALRTTAPRTAETTVFDPAELAESAVAMIRDSLPPGAVRMSCRTAEGLPRLVRADAHGLSQAVLTLLDDACSGPTRDALTLRLDFDAREGRLTLNLDQAGGRDAAQQGALALLRTLRLTILARLVASMDGTLSQTADGTRLSLPALAQAEDPAIHPIGEAGEPAHVLLVDDGATSGQILTLLLTQKGHRVCRVGDGEAALFACRDARHDLVVFDLASGEAARRSGLDGVRQFQLAQTGVPALVLANGVSPQEEARLRGWGVTAFLAKPFSPDALDAAVATAVATCRAAPPRPPVAIVDSAVRETLAQALGAATVERLTCELTGQVEALCGEPTFSGDARARLVELSSCASMLGLADLATHCAAARDSDAIGGALRRLLRELETAERAAA